MHFMDRNLYGFYIKILITLLLIVPITLALISAKKKSVNPEIETKTDIKVERVTSKEDEYPQWWMHQEEKYNEDADIPVIMSTDILYNCKTPEIADYTCYRISLYDGETWRNDELTKDFVRLSRNNPLKDKCFAIFESTDGIYYAMVEYSNNIPSEMESTEYVIVPENKWNEMIKK